MKTNNTNPNNKLNNSNTCHRAVTTHHSQLICHIVMSESHSWCSLSAIADCHASRDVHRQSCPTTCLHNDKPAQHVSRVSGGCVRAQNDTVVTPWTRHEHKQPQHQLILLSPPLSPSPARAALDSEVDSLEWKAWGRGPRSMVVAIVGSWCCCRRRSRSRLRCHCVAVLCLLLLLVLLLLLLWLLFA